MSELDDFYVQMSACNACKMRAGCRQVVIGTGQTKNPILFVCGEAPGESEDEQGEPFVGRAGQLLRDVLRRTKVLNRKNTLISNTLKCLYANSIILTSKGNKRINWIVKNKWHGEVLSVDDKGLLVWKKIIGWHRSPMGNRKLLRVAFQNGKNTCFGRVGVTVTSDHKFMTKRGWITAANLTSSDEIATGTPMPGERGMQVILGTMLGDACCSSGVFVVTHGNKQKKYMALKAKVLSGLKPVFDIDRKTRASINGKIHLQSGFILPRSLFFNDLRRKFYPRKGPKIMPNDVLEALNAFGMAIWYMDDGYWRYKKTRNGIKLLKGTYVEIALGNISKKNAELVAELMTKKGYNCYVKFRSTWRLQFRYGEGMKFLCDIAPYIPPCMRHKLPTELHNIPFNKREYEIDNVFTYWSSVIVCKPKVNPYQKSVYCIDVKDTFNFVTKGGVVHNCRPPNNKFPKDDSASICLSKWLLKELEIAKPQRMLLLGGVALEYVAGMSGITSVRGNWYDVRGIRTMATYHPSYVLRKEAERDISCMEAFEEDIGDVADEVRALEAKMLREQA